MGAGQPNRVNSARLAVERARDTLGGALADLGACYAVSDAFLPFRDTLDVLADAGVRVLLQPGGSLRDAEVIAVGAARGVAVVMTGTRHFRH
jgi:phosphoribosylaminoimidazolecarboxamide formyltransferase/IMP cyclohydrolase